MNHSIIPKGNYITDLRYGEDYGLLITLKNDTFCITLDFGAVVSVHCIDEGGMLFPPFAHDPYSLYRKIWGIDISVENLRTHEKTHSTVE